MSAADDTESPRTVIEPAAQPPRRRGAVPELERGASVGRYMVIERLGAGGMGVVYAAFDPELGRKVALKLVIRGDQERMLREAQALARLAHPNVVAIHDVGKHDDRVFVAMELVAGKTLSAWLRERPRSWREIVAMFVAAGRGLAAAHAAGIVHRDFKPANVLVGSDGRARVLDFGLARAAGELPEAEEAASASSQDLLGEELTKTGSVVGTPVYTPPEAFRGELVGMAGDQFSFCVALYEALYRERPFDRPWLDPAHPPELRAAPADTKVPAWLRKVVVRGLSERAADRYPAMDALLGALAADPARRQRTALAALAGVVGIAGIAAAGMMWRVRGGERAADPCAVSAPFAGIWDDAARARVRAAFASAGGPSAPGEFSRAAAGLDEATARWIDARTRACAQPRERDTAGSVLLLKLACFDQQKEELASLVELFEHADAATVKGAPGAVRQLQGPSACANARSLSLVAPPSEAQRPQVAELRAQLARANALRTTGKYKEALAMMPGIVDQARAAGFAPILAEALYRLAWAKTAFSNYTTDAELDECERIAVASRMDALAARAAARRFANGALIGKDPAVLRDWEARARTWIERDHDLEAESEYVLGLSNSAQNAGDYDANVKWMRRAIELADELYGPNSLSALDRRGNIAFSLILTGHYDEAIEILEDLVPRITSVYGDDGDDLAGALDNEGMALGMVGRYSDALAVLERAEGMTSISETTRGAVQCDKSRALLGQGRVAEAIAAGERGVALLRHSGIGGVNLANNLDPLAAASLAARRYQDALVQARDCLAVFRAARTKDQVDEVPCLAIEGAALVQLGKSGEAALVLDATLALQATAPAAPGVVANLRYQLARALVASHGDRGRARALVTEAREELAKYPFKQPLLDELDAWRAGAKLSN
jgi:tetratricopeptide (TPR) repeat protein